MVWPTSFEGEATGSNVRTRRGAGQSPPPYALYVSPSEHDAERRNGSNVPSHITTGLLRVLSHAKTLSLLTAGKRCFAVAECSARILRRQSTSRCPLNRSSRKHRRGNFSCNNQMCLSMWVSSARNAGSYICFPTATNCAASLTTINGESSD